jgi:protein-L-isoaspartate(D-aspartate) O-methyltransferase
MRPLLLAVALLCAAAAPARERARERDLMVLTIENIAATSGAGPNRIDRQVLRAMREVPRHLLVPEEVRPYAYRDSALPIGHDVTISQPYIVAAMTHLLEVRPGDKVLEVGTGSGYQAAILARLAGSVYSIEIIEPLARRAAAQLAELGYANVSVRAGDGYAGWPEQAPFDRIIVTAGADHVPRPLLEQLKPGGRMVIPVGRGGDLQLTLIRKDAKGRISRRQILPVRFVPLTRSPP